MSSKCDFYAKTTDSDIPPHPEKSRTPTPEKDSVSEYLDRKRKLSTTVSQPELSCKRPKKSEEQRLSGGKARSHDLGYLSGHSSASSLSRTSKTSATRSSETCGFSFHDAVLWDNSNSASDPLIWNCCRGPSRDKVSQVAGELFLSIGWCHPEMVMEYIDERDRKYNNLRDPLMLERHEEIEPYMRAILLDWMIDVCEEHNLERETYHLAVDYLDRFLSNTTNVRKSQLQLSGVTALFLASKLEEVNPPAVEDFAFVTDGACTAREILMHEKTVAQILGFKMYPLTANRWLEFFLQIGTKIRGRLIKELPFIPNALPAEILELCRLVEFSMMDVRCHLFSYRYVAAAAIYLFKDEAMALRVSGLPYEELKPCIDFMKPFYDVAKKSAPVECRYVKGHPRKTAFVFQNKNTAYNMVEIVWKCVAAEENRNYGYKLVK